MRQAARNKTKTIKGQKTCLKFVLQAPLLLNCNANIYSIYSIYSTYSTYSIYSNYSIYNTPPATPYNMRKM